MCVWLSLYVYAFLYMYIYLSSEKVILSRIRRNPCSAASFGITTLVMTASCCHGL